MDQVYSDEQLTLAARLYYVDGLAQAEVARFVKVSQATVSRLLSAARQRGIVKVSVAEYEPRSSELEEALVRKFRLKSAVVVRVVPGTKPEDVRCGLAHFSAATVQRLIPRYGTVAIAGGRTMRELVARMPKDFSRQVTVIQAMGSVDATAGPVDAYELGRSLANALGGRLLTLNTPAFAPDSKTRNSFLRLPQIQTAWNHLQDTKVALVGIGSLANSIFVERGVLSAAALRKLAGNGAVGEICGRFFNAQGRECDSPWRDRVISIELCRLRSVPEVVAIVAGADRSEAIIAAVRGGLVKTLVIDAQGAESLLNSSTIDHG